MPRLWNSIVPTIGKGDRAGDVACSGVGVDATCRVGVACRVGAACWVGVACRVGVDATCRVGVFLVLVYVASFVLVVYAEGPRFHADVVLAFKKKKIAY